MLNADINKVGFSFSQDISILKNTSPKLNAFKKVKSILDLNKIWQTYSGINNIKVNYL